MSKVWKVAVYRLIDLLISSHLLANTCLRNGKMKGRICGLNLYFNISIILLFRDPKNKLEKI